MMAVVDTANKSGSSGGGSAPADQALPKSLSPFVLALPSEWQTWLLQACLPAGDVVAESWRRWCDHVGDPIAFLKNARDGIKGMLPLLHHSLMAAGVDIERQVSTYLKTARLTEEVRLEAYDQICQQILTAISNRGISPIVMKGADLAYTIYDEPVLRHTDGLDFVVADEEIQAALDVLGTLGCGPPSTSRSARARTMDCRHRSGLVITLHTEIFDVPFAVSSEEMRSRCRVASVAGVRTRILSSADNLLYVCMNVFYGRTRASIRWAVDAWFLVSRCRDLDWEVLVASAGKSQIALPVFLTLRYLKEHLGAPIPQTVLSRLALLATQVGSTAREMAFSAVRRNGAIGVTDLLRTAGSWQNRARILKWMLVPTPSYMRWARRLDSGWELPLHYLKRPFRYIVRTKVPENAVGRTRSNDD